MANPPRQSDPDSCARTNPGNNKSYRLQRILSDARLPILFVLGLASLILGTIGFQRYFILTQEDKSLATALYNAIWLFTFEPGNLTDPIPWQLEIARWLSPVIAMYAVLLGFAAVFRDQFRLFSLGLWRNHVIICGMGQKGLNLARNFQQNGFGVVVIEQDGNNPNIASIRELGAAVQTGDGRDEYLLEKAGIKRARFLISVCGEDGVNADIAVIARKLAANRTQGKLHCAIHIGDPHLWVLLRAQEFAAGEDSPFRLDIFNIFDQGAKQLFREFPFADAPSPTGASPHLLITGLGDFSEQVVLNAARNWSPHYNGTQKRLHISIMDPLADIFINKLCQKYSLVDHLCEWNCLGFDSQSVEFIKAEFLIDQQAQENISMVYVLAENENIGLSSALALLERMKTSPIKILVRVNEEIGLANLIRETNKSTGAFEQLSLFGLMERTCQLDLVYNASHEAISRAIHEEYLRNEGLKGSLPGSSPILVSWDCLAEEYREMNREQADSIGTKLKAIRCDLMPWYDFGSDKFAFTADEIELMAKMEHKRWCEQKQKQGWVYGPARDDRLKIHPSMVPYDDPRLSEAEKDKDRDTVMQIPHYLALAGYQIYRLK